MIEARKVTVTGPRGTLYRNFSHTQLSITKESSKKLCVSVYFGEKRQVQCVNSVKSSIRNMIIGVTKGFLYKMRLVYAHFPINVVFATDKKSLEVRNYIGQKLNRRVEIPDGASVSMGKAKDEIIIEGNDIDAVSLTSSRLNQCARVHQRDIRKFLDGIYLLNKTSVQ